MPLIDRTYLIDNLHIANKADSAGVQLVLDRFIAKKEQEFLTDTLGVALFNEAMAGWGKQSDGTYLFVENGVYVQNVVIPDITDTNGNIFLTGGTDATVNQKTYNNIALKGYGYEVELYGSGTQKPNVDYVILNTGGFRFVNINWTQGMSVILHLRSAPQSVTTFDPALKWGYLLNGCDYTGIDGRLHHWSGFIDLRYNKKSPIANYVYFEYTNNMVTQSSGVGEVVGKTDSAVNVSPAFKMADAWNEIMDWHRELVYYMYTFGQANSLFPNWQYSYYWLFESKYGHVNTFGI